MGFTCYSPTIARGPNVSQPKKLIWRSINKPPWEGLKEKKRLDIDIIFDYIPDQV